MDASIRKLLANAENYATGEKNPALVEAYTLLRNVAETRPAVDAPESFGQDLYVLCAEFAFQNGRPDIARECLKMFFMKQPATNQFLARAYLCQAQLMAPDNANSSEQLEKAVVYILKAISFAKKSPRYHFLVYNASVIYWQFCRPFLKPGFRQFLARSLHQVVKALDDIEDKDYEWRAQLMIALIECHLDAHRRTDASQIATVASTFIKTNVPSLYKTVFGLMVRHQLVETAKLHKDLKTSPELAVYYKICKLKNRVKAAANPEVLEDKVSEEAVPSEREFEHEGEGEGEEDTTTAKTDITPAEIESPGSLTSLISVDERENRDFATDISNILTQMGVSTRDSLLVRSTEKLATERLTRRDSKMGRVSTGSSPSREDGEPERRLKVLDVSPKERPLLLLELARLCLELDLPSPASACVEAMKMCIVKEAGFHLELEFVQCELMVRSLGDKQESYNKSAVDTRLQAIKRCEEAILNAVRQGDPNVIQVGCVTQWNLCLPLLQPNLRKHVRRNLTVLAEALENIDSLLVQLRCQIHTELSRCEEDQEQISVAMENLKKALDLDDGSVYHERLEVALRRLELRAQLYKQPDRPEDQAAMIIEQARKADSGTMRMKRSLLLRAGEALAPDAFLLVLDSENDTKDVAPSPNLHTSSLNMSGGKGPQTKITQLAGKAVQFNHCVKKAEGHLKRLGDENDRERARLWGDLSKTARKQEVWDVCRVACRFCLLYDDGRWKNITPPKDKRSESPKPEKSRSDVSAREKDDEMPEKRSGSRLGSRPSTPQMVPLYDKDLIRMLAEVTFINGEALVQLLRSENVQLNDKPVPPVDTKKRPKGYVAKRPEEDPDWIEYCEWINDLSDSSTANFLRGLAIGVEMDEPWIVCSAAAYLWNYNNHILKQNRHREIITPLTTVLNGLKKVGHAGETVMLVNICNALAHGLIKPWMPNVPRSSASDAGDKEPEPVVVDVKGKGAKAAALTPKSKTVTISIHADAGPDLKKAIEVCDHVMAVTNGDNPRDVVPIFMRLPILQTWVQAKQMAQQQITKIPGSDEETTSGGQGPMTRAIVATQMLTLNKNGIMEFKDVPFIGDIVQLVEDARWSDKFVELQLWARLTYLAYEAKMHNMVVRCSKKALRFAAQGTQPRTRNMDLHKYSVEQEMLCYASCLLGQSLVDNMKGKNSLRREAMEALLNSAKYARSAGNYELVMIAARHFWNTSITLVGQPIERELLKEPLKIILECIAATADKAVKEEKTDLGDGDKKEEADEKDQDESMEKDKKALVKPKKSEAHSIGKPEDDLTLRAAMYGVLFQSYADQKEWTRALEAIDQAVHDMPRTKHRLLIFKHRVMVKAKLGRSVHMDIQKFKDESEDIVAHMWRRVALSSKDSSEQLASYQNAIESLENDTNDYQKVEYLLELGQWLYSNHFPLDDVHDQLQWAVDILLNIQPPAEVTGGTSYVFVKASATKARGSATKARGGKKEAKAKTPVQEKPAAKSPRSARSKTSSIERKDKDKKNAGKGKKAGSEKGDSKSVHSDKDSEIDAGDYVPVAKEADIGVLPANPNLQVKDLMDVRQLDALIRAHVLMAELFGQETQEHRDILLMAHAYLMQLWQILMSTCAHGIKEVVKNGGAINKDEPPKSGGGKPAKGKEKEKDGKADKPKIKRKIPVDALPADLETWGLYDWPDEGIEAFKMDSLKNVAISSDNIPKPMLTLHYMDSLVTLLRSVGYTHLSLPVLAFQDLLSRTVLANQALYKLVHLKSLEVCQELDLKSACAHHSKVLGSLHISEEDQAISRDQIGQWNEKQAQVAKEEMRVKETLASLTGKKNSVHPYKDSKASKGGAPQSLSVKDAGEKVDSHFGKVLGSVSVREVWADTAEVLIRQGHYQRAREYLNESNIAAEAFSDVSLKSRIQHLMAQLAYHEAQYGLAINLCHAAQSIKQEEEKFWFDSIVLLAESTIKEKYEIQNVRKAKKILVHAINEFQQVGENSPNRRHSARYYCSRLEALLLHMHVESMLHRYKDLNNPLVLQGVLEACDRYESIAEQLVSLCRWREACQVAMEHARLLRLLSSKSPEPDLCQVYFIQCQNVIKQAVGLAERVYTDVHTLFPIWQMKAISTPVQRELASIKVELADLLTDVLVVRDKELRRVQMQEERKHSIVRLVEDFIREEPEIDTAERQWMDMARIAGDEAMSHLLSANTLGANIPRLKAKSLVGMGRLLRVVAEFHGPDPAVQWQVHDVELLRMQLAVEEAEAEASAEASRAEAAAIELAAAEASALFSASELPEEETPPVEAPKPKQSIKDKGKKGKAEPEPTKPPTPEPDIENEPEEEPEVELDPKEREKVDRYTRKMTKKQDALEKSKLFYMCASECLGQALNLSLKEQYIDLASKASLEMFVLTGQYDSPAASMLLSLHQSCQSAINMKNVLWKSQPDPTTSKLAALLHQRAHMLQNDVTTNLSGSTVYKDAISSLHNDWQAWKRLGVQTNHLDLLKEFPSNYIFIVLQHSPDKNFLYGAVLDKPKGAGPSGAAAGKAKGQEKSNQSRARVFGAPTDFSDLETLLVQFAKHKRDVQSMLLKREYQRTQAAQRKQMLATLEDENRAMSKPVSRDGDLDVNENKIRRLIPASNETTIQEAELENEFEEIVGAMNAYLRPVLEQVTHSLSAVFRMEMNYLLGTNQTPVGSLVNLPDGAKASKDQVSPLTNEALILLADADLMRLPLEASPPLEVVEGVNSVCRDFSLEMLRARMCDDKQGNKKGEETGGKDAKGAAETKKKPPKEANNVLSRIPGVREAKAKQNKIIPLDRQPQAWQQAINTTDFRYIVDPNLECAETEPNKPIDEFDKILLKHEQQFTPRWLGVPGNEHTPSVGEWEIYLSESTAFIFYGLERLMSYIPPHKMPALNLTDCSMLLSFDLAETSKSFQRQSKLDVLKTATAISLECPVDTAILASLSGIKCYVGNQWHCTLAENSTKLHSTFNSLLDKGKTTGQAMYYLHNPHEQIREERALKQADVGNASNPPTDRKKSIAQESGKGKEVKAEADSEKHQLESEDAEHDTIYGEEEEDTDMPALTRSVYNTVCYGMPNLIVNQ